MNADFLNSITVDFVSTVAKYDKWTLFGKNWEWFPIM